MKHIATFITLGAILSWIISGQAQTVTETVPPNGPTVVVAFTSLNGGPAILTTIATLSGSSTPPSTNSSATPPPSVTSSTPTSSVTSSSNATDSSSDASDSDPSTRHIPSPVAMIAGSLAGFIAIVAAILVVCVTRRRRGGKRRRRRTSIIRALEAQHAHSGTNVDRDRYPVSDSGSLSDDHASTRRPGSATRSSIRESGRTGRKKSSRGSTKHTAHVRVSPSDDVELEWRDTESGPTQTRINAERPHTSTLTSPTSTSTLTNSTSTAATRVMTSNSSLDSKPKIILGDAHSPHTHSQDQSRPLSNGTHASSSPVLNSLSVPPQPVIRPSLSLPTAYRSDGDLPPAYEDDR